MIKANILTKIHYDNINKTIYIQETQLRCIQVPSITAVALVVTERLTYTQKNLRTSLDHDYIGHK